MSNEYHHQLPSYPQQSQSQQRPPIPISGIHLSPSSTDSPSSTALPRSVLVDNSITNDRPPIPYPYPFAQPQHGRPAAPALATSQQDLMQLNQWIATSPITTLQSPQYPFPVHPEGNNNYHLATPQSTSSYASTDYTSSSPSHSHSDDPYSYQNISSASLPTTSHTVHQTQHQHWPSSAPVPSTLESYIYAGSALELLPSPLSTAGFYSGMASLGLDKVGGTMSPREMLMSGTVVDADDFNAGTPDNNDGGMTSGTDYPVLGSSGIGGQRGHQQPPQQQQQQPFSSSYPGYNNDFTSSLGGFESPLMGYSNYPPNNLFATASSPPFVHRPQPQQQQSASPATDMATQFSLDLEDQKPSPFDQLGFAASTQAPATAKSSPASTIRPRRRRPGSSRPAELDCMVNSALNVKIEENQFWPTSAKDTRMTRSALLVPFDDQDGEGESEEHREEEEEENDEDDDGDGDYIDEPYHPGAAGPHRTIRRVSSLATGVFSSSSPSSAGKPRRSSPYSRSSRPSAAASRRHSHSDLKSSSATSNAAAASKKVKAVKWESTKPKYWIPEGFDPWWDQKSRGRGVATVSATSPVMASDEMDEEGGGWPADSLPPDWREMVRGKGNPSRPFVCPAVNCGKTFQRSEHAKRHAWSLHTPDAAKVSCPYEGCDHKSTRGDNLKQHIGSHKRKVVTPSTSASTSASNARRRSESGKRRVKYEEDLEDEQNWA